MTVLLLGVARAASLDATRRFRPTACTRPCEILLPRSLPSASAIHFRFYKNWLGF
jgi:hypothetical protein